MAVMDKQFFIDMAAVFVLPEVIRQHGPGTTDPRSVEEVAKGAYNVAEALWNEREKRYQAPQGETNEPEGSPTRVGPEF